MSSSKQTRITTSLLDKASLIARIQGRRGPRDIIEQAMTEHITRLMKDDPSLAQHLQESCTNQTPN